MKPANKFVICAVIAIVALTCGYLIYYTWSISFGEIDRSNFAIDDGEIKGSRYKIQDKNNSVTSKIVRNPTNKLSQRDIEDENDNSELNLHKNFHLFNRENCGKFKNEIHDRVVNGQPARFLANPWIAALYYEHPKQGNIMMCAGTLISGKTN